MHALTRQLFSKRFIKFCVTGASGVGVNMGFFFLFADVIGIHLHLALLAAIEISILSNFAINEAWTFRDRRGGNGSRGRRVFRFHTVSAVGGGIQWAVFALCNALVLRFLLSDGQMGDTDMWTRYIASPRDTGHWKYLSQLAGIGVATVFNFGANVYWTWGRERSEDRDG